MVGRSFERMENVALITGASGLLGNYLTRIAGRMASTVLTPTHGELDLTDAKSVSGFFQQKKPTMVFHCAAMSKTPACEANPGLARKTNVEATALLAELSSDIPFIFCSTDLVFDGQKGHYVEADSPNPLSVYAQTKVAAEQIVLKNPRHTVVRLSLNYGHSLTGNRSFNEDMCAALKAGKTCKLFVDEFRCPMAAEITAKAMVELVEKRAGGLFHLAGAERLSRWEIGELLIHRNPEYRPLLEKASLKEYRGAPRSPDTSLNSGKVQQLLSFPVPRFSEWLRQHE